MKALIGSVSSPKTPERLKEGLVKKYPQLEQYAQARTMVARSRLPRAERISHRSVLNELIEADAQSDRLIERAEKIKDFAEVD